MVTYLSTEIDDDDGKYNRDRRRARPISQLVRDHRRHHLTRGLLLFNGGGTAGDPKGRSGH